MTDDISARIAHIESMRAIIGDAAADAAIAALEATVPPTDVAQTVSGAGAVGIVGTVTNSPIRTTVYLYGQRGRSAEELLAAYLQRQVQRCTGLSFQGVRERRADTDMLTVSLDQVYTQLATTDLMEREVYEGAALASFDAAAYLAQHVGEHLLPRARRDQCLPHGGETPLRMGEEAAPLSLANLADQGSDHLAHLVQGRERVAFLGPRLVTEAITQYPRLVLLGEPGSGKSTALRYLALTLAQAGLDETVNLATHLEGWDRLGEQGRLLPLFLPLLPFARRFVAAADHPCSADDLWNYLAAELEASGRYEGLAAAVHEELEAGRVLLLLDGLDEVVGSTSRQQVVRAVQAFAKAYPACRLVVTCRVRAYEGAPNQAWQLPGWPTATLADWTVGQMQHFVQAWYGAAAASSRMSGEKRDERVTALKGAIERRGDLKRLGVRPLLLTIMALVHFNDGQLPEERVGLYSRCVDLLLGQWELAKEDGSGYGKLTDYLSLPDTDVKVLRPLLQAAAFAAHEASTPDVPGSLGRDTLRLMVMEALAQKGHPNPFQGAKRFLEYTDVRSGLLQASDAGDAYTFPHLTFQEYLAGLELVREVDFVQHILARRDDDRWRVPIQLGVGHLVSEGALAMVYQLLSELVYLEGRSEEQHQRDLLFASDLAEDIGWGRLKSAGFTRLRRDLAHALVSVVEGTVLPARERVRAGTLLGGLGDPRIPITPEEWSIASAGGTTDPLHRYWCHVPPGTYVVGSCDDARDARDDEKPQHTVTIAYPFWIARYPITNAQWQAWVAQGGKPSYRADDGDLNHPNQPVVRVTWQMFNDFCFWLTDQMGGVLPAGYAVQLPTEAEWEAAARGGDGRRYPWGDEWQDDHATTEANRRDLGTGWSTPVGCYATGAAPCGALDMAGNVWEWTADVWRSHPGAAEPFKEQEYRVLKGGSYRGGRTLVRCATRVTYHHDLNLIDFGGRVVVSPRVRTSGRDE